MSDIADVFARHARARPPKDPVWAGPEQDGVTFSLLSRFLVDRERFRLLVMEGLKPAETFNHRIEYGHMWHACEEAHAQGRVWNLALEVYCHELLGKYPLQRDQILKWYNVCGVQFPLYVEHWKEYDLADRVPLHGMSEHVFDVKYTLPSKRVVRLRGKWDSVDVINVGPAGPGLCNWETKTKSEVDEIQVRRQLPFDLQTMLYLVALKTEQQDSFWRRANKRWRDLPIRGVLYNVVRRPLSGGKGSIVQHKPSKSNPAGESTADYYNRLSGIIRESAGDFFMRWLVPVSEAQLSAFRRTCLDPLLEELCRWYDVVSHWHSMGQPDKVWEDSEARHWRHPFGVYNVLDEGGSTDLDEYLATGSEVGLRRVTQLFEELV